MSRFLLLSLLVLLLVPHAVRAEANPTGVHAYENGDYEAAAQVFEQVLADPRTSPEERGPALIYLAASLHAQTRVAEARKYLEALAREHPEQRVDSVRFPPELAELAEVVRQQVDTERDFAARTAELEKAKEEALRRRPSAPPLHLRPEVVGLVEAVDRQWTVGAGVALQREAFEGSARVLLGEPPAFHLQAGALLGGGKTLKPFVGLRASLLPGLDSYGAGPVVGARFALPADLVALVDVGADYFFIGRDDRYRVAVTAQAGLGFDVRLR